MPSLEEIERMLAAQGDALTEGGQEFGRQVIDAPIEAMREDWRKKANEPAPRVPVTPDPISGAARDQAVMSTGEMYERMRQKQAVPLEQRQMDDYERRQMEIAAEKRQAAEIANRRFQQEMAEKDAAELAAQARFAPSDMSGGNMSSRRFQALRKGLSGK